jgi:hypothetical protein
MDRRECGRERQWRFGGELVRQRHCLFEKIGGRHANVFGFASYSLPTRGAALWRLGHEQGLCDRDGFHGDGVRLDAGHPAVCALTALVGINYALHHGLLT